MGIDRTRGRARRTSVAVLVVGVAFLGVGLAGIEPAAADEAIVTAGPLTSVAITSDLNCAVNHSGDLSGEFYGDTACATEIAVAGTTYGPAAIPAGNNPGGYTAVSQTPVTGSGTILDPFTIVTVVDVGTTGLVLTETDRYVTGLEGYETDVQVANTTASPVSAVLYRGADCFLQGIDSGFGSVGNPPGAVACVAADSNNPSVPGSRIEQWLPLTGGSHYFEGAYTAVWAGMSSGANFPDTCDCATNEDNGAGLSWAINVPAQGSVTESQVTTISPLGSLPLTMTKTADQATVDAGAQDGYTITVSNPNPSAVALSTLTDVLPAGFGYVGGSTTGATTADPGVSGRILTWSGPLTVPAASGGTPGTLSLHFNATVSDIAGTYLNDAGATAQSFAIIPTGDTAPVLVNPTTTTSSSSTSTSSSTTMEPTSSTSSSTTMAPTSSTTTTTVEQHCWPGSGWGDEHHCHFGPPGHDPHDDRNFDRYGVRFGQTYGCLYGDRLLDKHSDESSAHFRLIGSANSSGVRWILVAAGAGLILMALALQRRVRRLW